jgi:polyisoprenoid-binding protein YceI
MSALPLPDVWQIDGVDFDVDAVWGLTIARGRFDRVAGSYDGTKIVLTVDPASVVTDNGTWDNLLPATEVRFSSIRIRDSGQGRLHVEGRLETTGKVVPVSFDAVVQRVDDGLRLAVTATVDRQELGTAGGRLGLILPATVHVRAHLTRVVGHVID